MKTRPSSFLKPILVTRPFLPTYEDFSDGMKEVWESHWLTNNGPQVQKFTAKLTDYFQTNNICLFNNGTLALQIGLQGMGISGEVITTPYSFVATTHVLYWNKIRPIFVDIEPDYFTLDPDKIEAAITPWTTAILAVHVYGYPCQLERLKAIAKKHNLKLLYDAAHAFGVTVNGTPIAHYGDLSMFSFHATKLFHSCEGGLLTFGQSGLKENFDYLKNFGFKDECEVVMPGTNAKMNELQAVMGLCVLRHVDAIIEKRKQIHDLYRKRLSTVSGILFSPQCHPSITYNYAYVPIQITPHEFGMSRDLFYDELKKFNIFCRRYFYPLICDYSCYQSVSITDPLTVARTVSKNILTLPIYHDLSLDEVNKICDIIEYIRYNTMT